MNIFNFEEEFSFLKFKFTFYKFQNYLYNKTIISANILPIRLPSQSDFNTFDGETGVLSGWGFNANKNKTEPNILQFIEEEILTNDECTAQNVNYPTIVDSEICISSNNGKTACPGENCDLILVNLLYFS